MRQISDWLAAVFVEFRVERERAVLFRFFFFMVVAVDAWLNIAHASRYGAGDFNVSHFAWLDAALPVPGRMAMTVMWMVQSVLAVRIALGAGTRWLPWILTTLYGTTYFISQIDSYQHHYLVFLALLILSSVRFDRRDPNVAGWPFRLLLAQISIMYLWAVVGKSNALWWDGSLLLQQAGSSELLVAVAKFFGMSIPVLCKVLAIGTVFVEIALAIAIHVRVLWPFVCAAGILFHAVIELAGFKIGLFSYFMIAIYLLLAPLVLSRRITTAWVPKWPSVSKNATLVSLVLALAVGAGCLLLVPLEGVVGVVIAVSFVAVVLQSEDGDAGTQPVLAQHASHAIACVVLLLLHVKTDVAFDYYRFLGGDSRRRADVKTAIFAYERTVEINPTYASAFRKLGDLYRLDGQLDRAREATRRANQLAPIGKPRQRGGQGSRR